MLYPDEFENTAKRYTRRLYAHAAVMLGSGADAEDAAEEAVCRLFLRNRPFESEEHAYAWLVRVTVNASLKILRRRKRFSEDTSALDTMTEDFAYPEDSELSQAVMSLSPGYRAVILLYYYDDMSAAEIGKILGISATAVTTRLDRARKQLKSILEGSMDNG